MDGCWTPFARLVQRLEANADTIKASRQAAGLLPVDNAKR